MQLAEYLQNVSGTGVLATANQEGEVDAAIFATPQVLSDGTVAFIMRDRLTHKNLQSNPGAHYLFMEEGRGYKGVRLFLKKIKEDTDPKLIAAMTRRHLPPDEDKARGPKFIVYFAVTRILPLIGSGASPIYP
ncbi:MAG: pyridoxamine 5'-phosphate oxidase family protein [Desulfobulbaceae bacterium]